MSPTAQGPPEEGVDKEFSDAAVHIEGELLLGLWDLARGFLRLEKGVEQTKPGRDPVSSQLVPFVLAGYPLGWYHRGCARREEGLLCGAWCPGRKRARPEDAG